MKILNTILLGDVFEQMKNIDDNSVDFIFVDPPYNMQLDGDLLRFDGSKFKGVEDEWDKFGSFEEYDQFTLKWLQECHRVLNKNGSICIIGSFQNIYRIGYFLQNLGFWILNDIIWSKSNPVPNFAGTRFCNSHETMIWCAKTKKSKITFNYKTMKSLNNNKQEKSVWTIPICSGNERLKNDKGSKLHSTQKPEELLYKIILAATKIDDVILDPFFGTGTTGVVAKRLKRNFIGIEKEELYVKAALKRIAETKVIDDEITNLKLETKPPRVSIKQLVDKNYIKINDFLYSKDLQNKCTINSDGSVNDGDENLSIHKMSAKFLNKQNNNGWDYFYVYFNDKLTSINELRYLYAKNELKQ